VRGAEWRSTPSGSGRSDVLVVAEDVVRVKRPLERGQAGELIGAVRRPDSFVAFVSEVVDVDGVFGIGLKRVPETARPRDVSFRLGGLRPERDDDDA
jgi:hypothetical protein